MFASVSCIEILLSYPECKESVRNKLGKEPVEVICERRPGDVRRIEELFEKRIYIAIYREEDGRTRVESINSPPEKVGLKVDAVAGPMSPQEAYELCTFIKSPVKRGRESPQVVRLTDHRKGIERLSRTKCHDLNVPWVESWPFLNKQIDLCSDEGLNCLEAHFRVSMNLLVIN